MILSNRYTLDWLFDGEDVSSGVAHDLGLEAVEVVEAVVVVDLGLGAVNVEILRLIPGDAEDLEE